MAKLPDVTSFGDRLTPKSVGGTVSYQPNTGADEFAADMTSKTGATITASGNYLSKVIQEEEKRTNTIRAEDAFNQLRSKQIDLTIGDDGFAKKTSGDAVNQPILKDYVDKFNVSAREIEESLQNDEQKSLFRRRASISGLQLKQDILSHVSKEHGVYSAQVFQGTIDLETKNAVERYQDPNGIAVSLSRVSAAISMEADRLGWPEEAQENAKKNVYSKINRGIIERMLANDDDISATNYYKANKDKISGEDSIMVEKALDIGSTRGEAQRVADELVSKTKLLGNAIQGADKIQDTKVRAEAKRLIREHFNDVEAAQNQDLELTFENAAKVAFETRDINKISPSVLSKLSAKPEYIKVLNSLASEEDINTNWSTYYDLKTMASSDATSSHFLKTNLLEYRDRLGETEFKEMVSIQTAMRKGDDKDIAGFRTAKQVVDDSLAAAKIDPTPKPGSPDATRAAEFRRQADVRIAALQEQKKTKLTPVEVQSVVDSMIVEGVTQKRWWWTDVKKRAFEVQPGESFEVDYEDIPQSERTKIEAALKGRKIPVTQDSVKSLYMKKLERDRGK